MGYRLNVMTHVPYLEDKANLSVGVYVIPTYSELRDGSRSVAIVLCNLTGKPVHLQAGRVIARVLAIKCHSRRKAHSRVDQEIGTNRTRSLPPRNSP